MRSSIVVLALVASALSLAMPRPNTVARALYPRKSAVVCVYGTCPKYDDVGDYSTGNTNDGTTLTCDYPSGNCEYDTVSLHPRYMYCVLICGLIPRLPA